MLVIICNKIKTAKAIEIPVMTLTFLNMTCLFGLGIDA